jgi:hypothetical protein
MLRAHRFSALRVTRESRSSRAFSTIQIDVRERRRCPIRDSRHQCGTSRARSAPSVKVASRKHAAVGISTSICVADNGAVFSASSNCLSSRGARYPASGVSRRSPPIGFASGPERRFVRGAPQFDVRARSSSRTSSEGRRRTGTVIAARTLTGLPGALSYATTSLVNGSRHGRAVLIRLKIRLLSQAKAPPLRLLICELTQRSCRTVLATDIAQRVIRMIDKLAKVFSCSSVVRCIS